MWVFLLLLGALTTAAGVMLVVPGVTIHDGTFNSEAITPGSVAAVGGLVLIGIGLAIRALQRIERLLSARPPLVTARAADGPVQSLSDAPRLPFPSKPPATPLGGRAAPAQAEGAGSEPIPARSVAAAVPSAGGVVRGAAGVGAAPNLDAKARLSVSSDTARGPVSATSRPATSRPRGGIASAQAAAQVAAQDATQVAAQVAGPPLAVATEAPVNEAAAGASPSRELPLEAPAVLKSGVVDGMAYTLYSDGSIEAQLPQGTLRFGSITALRHHIEGVS